MDPLPLFRAFTLVEPGPVILVTTLDGTRPNIMTVSWTMVRSFNAEFALTTGPWNHSWTALCDSREFVLSFPTSDMIDMVVGIGMCSGADTDKFARFGLTAVPASHVRAPLIKECLANIECRVEELIERLDLVLLRGGRGPCRCRPDRHSPASCCRRRDVYRRWREVRPARGDAREVARRAVGGP